ncbi:MAG TPA: hypothetical protein VMV55_03735 [Methanoregula sp.]|nr:hypothetical protein [Methanoregula sp.]
MTQSPDYEFGITEKEMLDLGNCISSEKGHWILKTVRSRKHGPPSGRDKVLQELFVWVDSEQTITITSDKIIKKILSLHTPAPEAKK